MMLSSEGERDPGGGGGEKRRPKRERIKREGMGKGFYCYLRGRVEEEWSNFEWSNRRREMFHVN